MRLARIHRRTSDVYHLAHAACLLAQAGAKVSTANGGDTWLIQWGKA